MSNIDRRYDYHDDGVLPSDGEYGVTYLTLYSSGAGNVYDGWIWDPEDKIPESETARTFGYRNPDYPEYCWDDEVIVDLSNAQSRQESSEFAQGRITSFNTNVSNVPIVLDDIDIIGLTEEEREAKATVVLFSAIPLVQDAYIQAMVEVQMKANLSPSNTNGMMRVEAFYILNDESDRTMRPNPVHTFAVATQNERHTLPFLYWNPALKHEDSNYIGVKLLCTGGTAEIGISDDPDYGDAMITLTSAGLTGDHIDDGKPVRIDIYGKEYIPFGYKLKVDDYTVLCTYDTGEIYDVTRLCTFNPVMGTKLIEPETILTANYQGLSASMTLYMALVESIQLIGLADIYEDYNFSLDDYAVLAHYDSGDIMDVTRDPECTYNIAEGTVISTSTTLTATYAPSYMPGSSFTDSLAIEKHTAISSASNFANGLVYTLYDDDLVDVTGNADIAINVGEAHEYIMIPSSIQTAITSRSIATYRMRWNASGEISGFFLQKWDTDTGNVTFVNFENISIKPFYARITSHSGSSILSNPIIMSFTRQKVITAENIEFLNNITYTIVDDLPIIMTDNYTNLGQDSLGSLGYCFDGCESLRSTHPLRNWDVSRVNNLGYMFRDTHITDVEGLANWNTSMVAEVTQMFERCRYLSDISGLKHWDVSRVTDFSLVFDGCESLESARDIGTWDSSNAGGIGGMFYYSGLNTLVGLDTFLLNAGSNVETQYINTSNTFHYSGLINLSGLPYNIFTDGKIRPYQLFQNCRYLETLDGADLLDLSECTDISYMFVNCKSLTDISACSDWDVSNVTGFASLFGGCDLLADITPTTGWDLGSATSVKGMFMKSSARDTTTYTLSEIEEWRCSNNQFAEYLSALTDDVVLDLINSQYYTEPHLRIGKAYVENSPAGKEYRVTSNSMFGGRDIFELVKISNTQYQLTFLNPNATPAWYREKVAYYVTRGLI